MNETTKDNERWGTTTREGEYHVLVKKYEQESETKCKREYMREKRPMWVRENCGAAARAHKSENEGGRQSVKVKTVKLEAPRRFWASNRRGANPNFTQLFPQFTQRDHDIGWSPITDVMVGHTTSVCSS